MSTFKGIVAGMAHVSTFEAASLLYASEFPQIRIDYFRHQPEHKAPLACFLSHVHSDHLMGLETFRAPFVYCSAATREASASSLRLDLRRPTNLADPTTPGEIPLSSQFCQRHS